MSNPQTSVQSQTPLQFLEAPEHPDVAKLLDYWTSKCGLRPMPDRSDIVPSEILRQLPFIFICEAVDQGADFRFRLCGTAIVNLVGAELTGLQILQFDKPPQVITDITAAKHRWFDIVSTSFKTQKPTFVASTFINTVHRQIAWHSFTAPLTTGGSEVTQVLGGLFFDTRL
jgi:hypothetical protein